MAKIDKQQFTTLKVSKALHKAGFDLSTDYYWFRTVQDDRAKLRRIEGEFYLLPTTQVYHAYSLAALLNLLDDKFLLHGQGFTFRGKVWERKPRETLADLVGRSILYLIEVGALQRV